MKKYKIAIVGATGAVGREMLRCIFQFNFPFESIKLLASARSAGKIIEFENKKFTVEELTEDSFKGIDVAFWSAGGSISEKYVPFAVKAGCINIDNTSHFRMDPNVPLVVPEVNGEALRNHKGIIANPNCTTIQMVSALNRLNEYFDIERIIDKKHFPIAFNCIPQVDKFDLDNHFSKEEMKMVNETKKIFNKDIKVNATCVRVPVLRGHSESVYIETKKPIDIDKVFELLNNSTGVELYDDLENQIYPMANLFVGDELVHVGRVRKDLDNPNGLSLWVVADQLMKGAAYNSVDIGLKMIEMGLI
ncbi:aspartate-semialdehyde dehydrogenase [[Clostridium] cocleatum]|uniref:aspartate-semialdehyde dehydrogenase n=1 Tax=Thomasclavelia cocleata TaxID=69824 RepID=UPI00138F7CBF|nr:Asd/ArgC dimerization domain-containing protein [Thomasclavelia cocleata]NDO42608.1 aspartate-semialdehyde dehydrogenase [Thomasclavelia cocleata]